MNGIHENLSMEQKVQLLQSDFLGRDSDSNFVKIRRTGRLGWESTLPAESAYSDFLLHPENDEDLITNAYKQAGDMLTVMDTPFKVNVKITNDSSCTDSNTVWVATEMFDDNDLSVGQKLDTFLGLAIHEGCHLLYTDFDATTAIQTKLLGALQNIIEDERIERECGESKPGLANFLKSSKYYYFDRYCQKMKKGDKEASQQVFTRLLNCILSMVRYPKVMNPLDLEEFADVLLEVRGILQPYPTSTRESIEAAKEIEKVMMDFLQSKKEKAHEECHNEGSMSEAPTDKNDTLGESKCSKKDCSKGQKESLQDTPSSGTSDSSKEEDDQDLQLEVDSAMDSLGSALQEILSSPRKDHLEEDRQAQTVKVDDELIGQICEGRVTRGSQADTFIRKATDNKDSYLDSLSRVKRFIPSIARALRCSTMEYKLTYRGMRIGVLDSGKLAEAYQGVPTVYIREGQVRSDKVAVCILIDESGSMWGAGDIPARDTAVLINEALSTIPNVDLYIYGHSTTGGGTELFVYREGAYRPRYALGSTDSRCGNHDSIAIREVASRVRRHTDSKALFFMISDGSPNEEPWVVRKAVQQVEKDGFSLVAISIDPKYDPAMMYEHNVNLSDMSSLAIDLGKLVKKAVMGATKRKIV